MRLRSCVQYVAFVALTFAAVDTVLSAAIHRGYDLPRSHPLFKNTWIVEREVLRDSDWLDLQSRNLIVATTVWMFATSGSSITLPRDFNPSNNSVYAVGSGAGGQTGSFAPCPMAFCVGQGGFGGGGGAFSQINNFNGTPNTGVSIQVGSGDTWFNSTSTLLAKAASGQTGGSASSGVGTLKYSGGSGGNGLSSSGSGGGGGGAGGPHGAGNGGNAGNVNGSGGTGGTGDAGNTATQTNGTQFGPNVSSQFTGPGGGGTGGLCQGVNVTAGNNAGFYGGGGGGGAGGLPAGCSPPGAGGSGTQGLIALTYLSVITAQAINLAMMGM